MKSDLILNDPKDKQTLMMKVQCLQCSDIVTRLLIISEKRPKFNVI